MTTTKSDSVADELGGHHYRPTVGTVGTVHSKLSTVISIDRTSADEIRTGKDLNRTRQISTGPGASSNGIHQRTILSILATMTGQPLRRSPRLAAKKAEAAKKDEAAQAHAPKCIPGILRARKAASSGASKSPVGVKFGRNAVAEFEKENPPDELEPLSDDEAEQLFPHCCIVESLIDNQTKRNEEILEKWDELFEDWDYSDDSSVDSDDSDIHVSSKHQKYYSGACGNSGYIVVEEKEIDYLAIAIPDTFACQPKEENNEVPTIRVDVYFCDFCKRGVRRATKYFHE